MASHSDPAGAAVDWESRYLAGDTPWDKGSPHPALVDWLDGHRVHGRILVPGCGAGHDVRSLSGDPDAVVTGMDISPSALKIARGFPPVGRESYILGDFLAGVAPGPFDWIFEHTCFCAIEPVMRSAYARSAAEALAPEGCLLAIFYRDPDHVGGPPFGCTPDEIDGLFGRYFEPLESRVGLKTFEGREEREWLQVFRRK